MELMYECPDCRKESLESEWNYITRDTFGPGIVPISTASRHMPGAEFTCPICGTDSEAKWIHEVPMPRTNHEATRLLKRW